MIIGYSRTFPRVGPSWSTTFSESMTGLSTGWSGWDLRQVINSSLLSASATSLTRVTLQAPTSGGQGFTIDHAYIGEQGAGNVWNFDGNQVPLTFSGSAGVTVPLNGTAVSDAVPFVLDRTKNLVLAFHFSAASSIAEQGAITGTAGYGHSAADDTSVTSPSGYATQGSLFLVNKIEVE
jgi:hypothetical protein